MLLNAWIDHSAEVKADWKPDDVVIRVIITSRDDVIRLLIPATVAQDLADRLAKALMASVSEEAE